MKRAIANSRCEVDGRVYLPGDDMTVTTEQLDYLVSKGAAVEIPMHTGVSSALPTLEEVTSQGVHGAYAKKLKAERRDKR